MYGWITGILSGDGDHGVSRMRVQKVAYLLENGLALGLYQTHKRHRFGPYDPSLTYRDGEPGCLKKGYLVKGPDHLLRRGPKYAQAANYAVRYVRDEPVARALVENLKTLDESALETLATVHSAATQLADGSITTEAVTAVIHTDPTWREKLNRQNFTAATIHGALQTLSSLRLL